MKLKNLIYTLNLWPQNSLGKILIVRGEVKGFQVGFSFYNLYSHHIVTYWPFERPF